MVKTNDEAVAQVRNVLADDMSGFSLRAVARGHSGDLQSSVWDLARVAYSKKGMRLAKSIECNGFILDLFANPWHDPALALTSESDGRFCTYCGTLIYAGGTGTGATKAILHDVKTKGMNCLDTACGNYCLILCDASGLKILTDRSGLHHVYHASDGTASNSFISIACSRPQHTFASQEILEYILFGATFGEGTLLDEVKLLGAEDTIEAQDGRLRVVQRKTAWISESNWASSMETMDRVRKTLELADEYYGQLARAFRSRITASLSGGYDSRLNLGLLQRHGVSPELFVYGTADEADVLVAKMVCREEGLELTHVDRGKCDHLNPDEYWQNQEEVFHGLDGLTQYGYACEPYEISHRRERIIGGKVVVNGGGGEIWRDYWKLPDRSMSAWHFARAYFGGRGTGVVGGPQALSRVQKCIGEKIARLTGIHGAMPSHVVQSLYARLRLRFWQGKNNSVDNFLGYAITPFSEHHFSVPAMWIPMSLKRHGWFETKLIQGVSERLATYPSSHGYRLVAGPDVSSRIKAAVTRHLPLWIRAMRRRQLLTHGRRYFHSEPFVRARFGTGNLAVSELVELCRLGDALAFSRALSVERMLRGEWL